MRQFAAGKDVLDVGCGTGYGTAHLADVAKSIIGIDYSASAIKWARKHYPTVDFLQMDAVRPQLPDKSFDLIVSNENFEHLPDQKKHTQELARLLRPDGLCFVATPNPEIFPGNHNRYHFKENTFSELTELFASCFADVSILENTMEPFTAEGKEMKAARLSRQEIGLASLPFSCDQTWLDNAASFFCFMRSPQR
jgi:2-polyprenyl-3-methyl-5-hydroxy-6-metoxy-1,4-benzoquinol methylase